MNINAQKIYPFYLELFNKIRNKEFIINSNKVKTVELIAPKIELDPSDLYIDFEKRKSPRKYIEKEMNWYLSHSLNIKGVDDVSIWRKVSDKNKEINSNYGNLVFSRNNFSQFNNVIDSLKRDKESRQGIIIYTRPSIHYEWNSHNAHDFICTNYQQFFIRENKLITITNMRSNDCWFGTFSDIPWFHFVINKMFEELKSEYIDLNLGEHIFIPNSFHCYDLNFDKLIDMIEYEKTYGAMNE